MSFSNYGRPTLKDIKRELLKLYEFYAKMMSLVVKMEGSKFPRVDYGRGHMILAVIA
jgi:hypothetical protein